MAKLVKKNKTAKPQKKVVFKEVSPEKYKSMSFLERRKYNYHKRADKRAREHAEILASLPKDKSARFRAHFNIKRIFHYWTCSYGRHKLFKALMACILIGIITIGGLFVVYKKSLEDISLSNLNISDTVNTYLDRNGTVLWKDTGDANYRLVVDGSEISTYMRQATVAIEDKNFYNHPGVDFTALTRAAISTLTGQGVQGGSTLTQQLIKQVYFADEAASANRGGITRKIKELILALELEKMYDKEQIITMYLNESPYGGRRNGVESAARTYFDKSAKELTLAESALLAGIPNNPAILNPYNTYGNEALIERQHKVLDSMAELGYITVDEAEEAKLVDVLAEIKPETTQYADILAPHFVLEVKSQLEEKYGMATMRAGGLTIKTTLDYRAQQLAEEAVAAGMRTAATTNGADNAALVSIDVETSQIIAMVGSYDFNQQGYGEVNVTTSLMEPGSSIKPVLDYTPLFMQREGQNYGPGSVLRDENIDNIYCAGYTGGACSMRNFSGAFYGNVTIRQSLANSLNIPAVKALYINGVDKSLEVLHELGDVSYCADRNDAGLSIAIGSGCNIRPTEHVNTYASIARGGAYKDIAYVLEIKNAAGEVIESWEDSEAKQVVDPQVAYMIADILGDANARKLTLGSLATSYGFVVPGVWTGTKTGTTTTTNSSVAKDSWMVSFSPAIATLVWSGNHNGAGLRSSSNSAVARMIANYMEPVHKQIYAQEGKWKSGDQPEKPSGIQTLAVGGTKDIWPSWFNAGKNSGVEKVQLEFNKFTGKLAAPCTLDEYKVSVTATKTIDPMTKKEVFSVPDGYDYNSTDDCSYVHSKPSVTANAEGNVITINITKGSGDLDTYKLYVDGTEKESGKITSTAFYAGYKLTGKEKEIKIVVTDSYGSEGSYSF